MYSDNFFFSLFLHFFSYSYLTLRFCLKISFHLKNSSNCNIHRLYSAKPRQFQEISFNRFQIILWCTLCGLSLLKSAYYHLLKIGPNNQIKLILKCDQMQINDWPDYPTKSCNHLIFYQRLQAERRWFSTTENYKKSAGFLVQKTR